MGDMEAIRSNLKEYINLLQSNIFFLVQDLGTYNEELQQKYEFSLQLSNGEYKMHYYSYNDALFSFITSASTVANYEASKFTEHENQMDNANKHLYFIIYNGLNNLRRVNLKLQDIFREASAQKIGSSQKSLLLILMNGVAITICLMIFNLLSSMPHTLHLQSYTSLGTREKSSGCSASSASSTSTRTRRRRRSIMNALPYR